VALRKGQAAIFDGITFLLLATFSATLIFTAVGTYGEQEDEVMRSSYVINYMQTVSKAFYHVDAQQLAGVCGEGGDKCEEIEVYADLAGKCVELEQYLPGISLSDLLKKDLAYSGSPVLDDSYGGIEALGKTATRCAAKEFMKPFTSAGYDYVIEIVQPSSVALIGDAETGESAVIKTSTPIISNLPENAKENDYIEEKDGFVETSVCFNALNAGEKVFSVASVFKEKTKNSNGKIIENQLVLRVCMWPSRQQISSTLLRS